MAQIKVNRKEEDLGDNDDESGGLSNDNGEKTIKTIAHKKIGIYFAAEKSFTFRESEASKEGGGQEKML